MPSRLSRFLLFLLFPMLSACALPYYLQAARGQAKLLRQREPIDELLADPALDAATRDRLILVTDLRRFAVGHLGLPDNDSYTSYVGLGRDYVVWNVVAAEEFSVEPLGWCFPVAGCVSYRGYFERERALEFEAKLASQGYDTFVGGATAYSTLGYFADPVLDTMLRQGDTAIAATLFHELAHQQLYVKDDTELSESFATAVEQYGVEAWLDSQDRGSALADYRASLERRAQFAALVARHRETLAQLFAMDAEAATLRSRKAEANAAMRSEYEALRDDAWDGNRDYDGWFDGGFNNARLAALTSYQRWVPGLRAELERLGPEAFFAAMEALLELEPASRRSRLEAWNLASVPAALPDPGELVGRPAEIGRDDRLHPLRHDAEGGEAVVAADAGDRQ